MFFWRGTVLQDSSLIHFMTYFFPFSAMVWLSSMRLSVAGMLWQPGGTFQPNLLRWNIIRNELKQFVKILGVKFFNWWTWHVIFLIFHDFEIFAKLNSNRIQWEPYRDIAVGELMAVEAAFVALLDKARTNTCHPTIRAGHMRQLLSQSDTVLKGQTIVTSFLTTWGRQRVNHMCNLLRCCLSRFLIFVASPALLTSSKFFVGTS